MPALRVGQFRPSRRPGRRPPAAGFTLIEVLIAAVVLVIAAMAAVLHITRSTQRGAWARDRIFAQQRALSILNELRAHVLSAPGVVAADLAQFDDGVGFNPTLTILRDPLEPDADLAPDHPLSGNHREQGVWRWSRQLRVAPFGEQEETVDKRLCTVRIYRRVPFEQAPGTKMAEIAGLIQTVNDPLLTRQVFDVYVLALENHPGTWVDADARRSAVSGALLSLGLKNPGLEFRVHWITKAGYGRDDEYAPFANETRLSTEATPWTYVYPGRLPAGPGRPERFYDPSQIGARLNIDGVTAPAFANDYAPLESFSDLNGNGAYDEGEPVVDTNGNGTWDPGNPVPYALADGRNHCLRWPEAVERFAARVEAGTESEAEPTWRLLLDRMAADPQRYHNAILLNLHGEVLPMPPVRNVSDPCKAPSYFPGWRAVTHPERLHALRVAGDDATSTAPRLRVYAWKASFENAEPCMTLEEPYVDADHNGLYDPGETFEDWNGNGAWDLSVPLTLVIPGANLAWNVNGSADPSLVVRHLAGGVDADGDGTPEPYQDWRAPRRYPELWVDFNANDLHEVQEAWLDLDGDGARDADEPYQELDGNGVFTAESEPLNDANGNGRHDRAAPAESFTDVNGNGRWDPAEPFWDRDGNGAWTPPTIPASPWVPWNPADHGNAVATNLYIASYGEPFLDQDGDGTYDEAEPLVDRNGNGLWDGGFARGEMWYRVAYDAVAKQTVISLFGTPLETPREAASGRGLGPAWRLYDYDYVPCPTPASAADPDRFARDLYEPGDVPKNTARWIIEIPPAALRRGFESAPGQRDGDAVDRILGVQTRIGYDLEAGVLWPVRNSPANLSTTYVYCYADAADIPFSERYQFLGDPRHYPYADGDRVGVSFPHAYNTCFDDFRTSGDAQAAWPAFDPARLEAGWLQRHDADVPRLMAWLRRALTRSEAVFATLPGFSFRYLTLGGEVGFPTAGLPLDGTPFGQGNAVEENTLGLAGTVGLAGCVKLARSNAGGDGGLRAGGRWWSRPWLGELAPDATYDAQWSVTGNLHAAADLTGYRLVRRDAVGLAQQPAGTWMSAARAELGDEGCTSFFNSGAATATFHHRAAAAVGSLVLEGVPVGATYGLEVPLGMSIAHPFQVAWSGDGGTGPEFAFPADFPRHTATLAARFVAEDAGGGAAQGSATVRLSAPAGDVARIVVSGLDPASSTGATFFAQLVPLTALHTFFSEGLSGTPARVLQLPRLRITAPRASRTLQDPATVTLQWETTWRRWDGEPYTPDHPDTFAESEADLAYHLLYSIDGGQSWSNLLDGSATQPGVLPRSGGNPDPARALIDTVSGGPETHAWSTPAERVPAGTCLIRIEGHRRAERLHYAYCEERVHVLR